MQRFSLDGKGKKGAPRPTTTMTGMEVAGKFKIGPKLDIESFREYYAGTDMESGEEVTIKLEPIGCINPSLLYKTKIYRILEGGCKSLNFGEIFC